MRHSGVGRKQRGRSRLWERECCEEIIEAYHNDMYIVDKLVMEQQVIRKKRGRAGGCACKNLAN